MTLSPEELRGLTRRLWHLTPTQACYAWCKARMDPSYPLVLAELATSRDVVDLGAGLGLVAALFAARHPEARLRAVEWDPRKARRARRLTGDLPGVSVEEGDLRTAPLGSPDAILLLDALHYIPAADQRAALTRCAEALTPGGRLLLRDLEAPPGRPTAAERLERLAVGLRWTRGGHVQPWPVSEMGEHLRGLGFETSLRPLGRGPFSANAFLSARKPR